MEEDIETITQDKCKGITNYEEMRKLCEELQPEIVEHMLNKYRSQILEGKKQSKFSKLFIVGGQNASGKAKLINELIQVSDQKAVSIIIDDMKAHHPFREYIDKNFPNKSEELLHLACFDVFNKILTFLLKEGYDIIIERTLGEKNKIRQFLAEAANYNYDIEIHVTATHEINSLLSSLERFVYECRLKDEFDKNKSNLRIAPRPIALEHHDNTYKNICDVLQAAENGYFKDTNGESVYPKIFIWDRTPERPTNIYVTGEQRYSCAKQAMYDGRDNDLKRCNSSEDYGFNTRVKNIKLELNNTCTNSTLEQYKDYCNKFLNEIEKRGNSYINKNLGKEQ